MCIQVNNAVRKIYFIGRYTTIDVPGLGLGQNGKGPHRKIVYIWQCNCQVCQRFANISFFIKIHVAFQHSVCTQNCFDFRCLCIHSADSYIILCHSQVQILFNLSVSLVDQLFFVFIQFCCYFITTLNSYAGSDSFSHINSLTDQFF
ncbi:hypothetical protein D1872_245590 [compost metagenome]